MTQTPPNPPPPIRAFEWFRSMMIRLSMDLSASVAWGWITMPMLIQVSGFLRPNRLKLERLIAMLRAGTYKPRKPRQPSEDTATRAASPRKPLPPGWLPKKYGWLKPYIPEQLRPFGGQITALLQDPEMAALVAQAPEAFGRPLRTLCWAFGWKPPAIIAPPKRPRKPKPEKPAVEKPEPEPPLEWDWNGRLTPEQRANVPHADPLIYRMGIKGVRRPKGTRRGPPKMA